MKSYLTFIQESEDIRKRIISRAAKLANDSRDNQDKRRILVQLIRNVNSHYAPKKLEHEYEGRTAARRDKHLEPTYRLSPEQQQNNPKTITKNPKKLRKQKALREID
jgi:hypothetical protein